MDVAGEGLLYAELECKSIKKEKSHVVDYRCNSSHPVAARLFRWKHKSKFPEDRQLDSHAARHCHRPDRSERVGSHLGLRQVENRRGGLLWPPLHAQYKTVDMVTKVLQLMHGENTVYAIFEMKMDVVGRET
jgi:hypothetical protein